MSTIILTIFIKFIFSYLYLESFQDFFDQHALVFENAAAQPAEEQNLEYYDLFQRYLRLYEANLSDYISSLDCTIEEFYEQLQGFIFSIKFYECILI